MSRIIFAVVVITSLVTGVIVSGCSNRSLSMSATDDLADEHVDFDEGAYERAIEILNKVPEEAPVAETTPGSDELQEPAEGNTEVTTPTDPANPTTPTDPTAPTAPLTIPEDTGLDTDIVDGDDVSSGVLPESEARELMEFVDTATLKIMRESSESSKEVPAVHRFCKGDGLNAKTQKYHEDVDDECLLPKMQTASKLFNIRYSFARCIFEQENPHRDRLAHNINGNGLAQIVNTTMIEINKRWSKGDVLSGVLKQCLRANSNRTDTYLDPIDKLVVPRKYDKSDIFREASRRPPTNRLNPLYRDDSLCMGLMTMGIKVQEANNRKEHKPVSDGELARRYNGSKNQQRYARAVVKCVARYKKSSRLVKN
jgi:hypothetical protein